MSSCAVVVRVAARTTILVANRQQQLSRLAVELRVATGVALATGSWFAPTLDDCRVDIERMLSLGRDDDAIDAQALISRSGLALRTWRQLVEFSGRGRSADRCACGGLVVPIARAGRLAPYAGWQLEIPAELPIPTCDRCGAESLDAETAALVDAALLSAHVRRGGQKSSGD